MYSRERADGDPADLADTNDAFNRRSHLCHRVIGCYAGPDRNERAFGAGR
jgi:hypothetical protein